MKELNIRSVRWPGGNYVSGYNWEDGIGPKEQRPARMELAWHQVENKQMGTDEYAKFCSLIGADNFLRINAGTGTLDDTRQSCILSLPIRLPRLKYLINKTLI